MKTPSTEERVYAELRSLRDKVAGICGSLVATSDGLLVSSDIPDLEPTRLAALVSTTLGLARQTTLATGRGQFREAIARGTDGYLAVFAAGSAVIAVIADDDINIGMLHYEAREVIERITAHSANFVRWSVQAGTAPSAEVTAGGSSG
jgi:predicted regulator of Ras-like GTPase activity (Roadblock/LC7/MglB family)